MKLKLATKIKVLALIIVAFSVLFSGFFLAYKVAGELKKELGKRALAIGRTVAENSTVKKYLGKPEGFKKIEPIAERIRQVTNVDYIVVLDMKKIRYSSPLPEKVGTKFFGGDEELAFADNEYISEAKGINGVAIRAFVPVKNEDFTDQIGVVVVGILLPTWWKLLKSVRGGIYLATIWGLLIGLIGASLLAKKIKNEILGLEPEEIASLMEQRNALLNTINEGIIAIDRLGTITLINPAAQKILAEKNIAEIISESRLLEVIKTGKPIYNRVIFVEEKQLISTSLPLKVKGEVIGAFTVFREKSEVQKLAEELTGVKKFVEALRVQNHENLNRLHSIAGLIQLGRVEEALDLIFRLTDAQQALTTFLTKNIKDPALAGLILGKVARASELKVELKVSRRSFVEAYPVKLDSTKVIEIAGNILENSLEAAALSEVKKVFFKIQATQNHFKLLVLDTGPGLMIEHEKIFEPGFSTKGENRGYGLYIVKKHLQEADGKVRIRSTAKRTAFLLEVRGDKNDD